MNFKKQSGAVLITSLILLIALTILVIASTQSGITQEKMTVAVRESHVSLEMAESGARDAEKFIDTLIDTSSFNDLGTGGKYSKDNGPADLFATANWGVKSIAATTGVSVLTTRYFIEHLGLLSTATVAAAPVDPSITGYGETSTVGTAHLFKIVSRSMGDNGNSERIIVSYYAKSF
jgi:type IV pilus assembly protein PilX